VTEINIQPIALVKPVTDNYFGIDIVDNYRYMENFNDAAVQQWVKAQADFTIETLAQLPICRAITERSDLFAAAISRVGLLNPVRLETTSNGVNNVPEFGSGQTEAGFQSLYAMDPFLHVKDGMNYPAMMITHGINDGSCEPWQSTKFAARVQATSASNKPVLLRIYYEAGHGVGSTKTQQIQERTDIFAFMMWQFGTEIG
jgi:prolyl oligopeptidase